MKSFHATILLAFVPHIIAFFSTRLRDPSSRIYRRTTKLDSDETRKSYETVAQHDPEWYQRYVTNVLEDAEILRSEIEEQAVDAEELINEKTPSTREASEPEALKSQKQVTLISSVSKINLSPQSKHKLTSDVVIVSNVLNSTEHTKTPTSCSPRPDILQHEELHDVLECTNCALGQNHYNTSVLESDIIFDSKHGNNETKNLGSPNTNEIGGYYGIIDTESQSPIMRMAGEINESHVDKDEEKNIILYRDFFTGELSAADLLTLTKLGYDAQEIRLINCDVLSVLIEDKINKPRRGVPSRWKVKVDKKNSLKGAPRVISFQEFRQILQTRSDDRLQRYASAKYGIPVSRQQHDKTYEYYPREMESRKRLMNYQAQRDDPPPPPCTSFWVDIDYFRDLLRFEAEWRIGILGNDWKDVLKLECKWRLALYKEWLWSLFFTRKFGYSIARASCYATLVLSFHFYFLVPAMANPLLPGH